MASKSHTFYYIFVSSCCKRGACHKPIIHASLLLYRIPKLAVPGTREPQSVLWSSLKKWRSFKTLEEQRAERSTCSNPLLSGMVFYLSFTQQSQHRSFHQLTFIMINCFSKLFLFLYRFVIAAQMNCVTLHFHATEHCRNEKEA